MNGPKNVPQPIPYQGSKRQLAPQILEWFPDKFHRIVEPFAGSAAISIAVASQKRSSKYWLNDAHSPLICLWKDIIENPDGLADKYEALWNEQLGREREYFNFIRSRFNKSHDTADFLYLLARCVKAAIRYNCNGEFNNTPDNRRRGARPTEMQRRILRTSLLFNSRTKLTSLDYQVVLKKCTSKDLVYMDPPYQGVCGNRDQRYLPKIDHTEFCEALAELNYRRIMFAVSYDGRTGSKAFGSQLPDSLDLKHMELTAGRSTQATLLGRDDMTFEAFYLSPALVDNLGTNPRTKINQLALW